MSHVSQIDYQFISIECQSICELANEQLYKLDKILENIESGSSQLLNSQTDALKEEILKSKRNIEDNIKSLINKVKRYADSNYRGEYGDDYNLINEARNLKQLGQDIKNLNIDRISDIILKLQNYKVEADRTLNENLTKLDNISKHFSLNQSEFKQGGEWTQKQAKQVEERVEKMRDDVKKIIIKLNEKTQTGYMPSLERVKEIMRLTRDINDADGIVEVTQALGSLTAYMATIMIDIRELLIDQNQLVANVSAAEETEKDTVKQRQKEEEEENERIHEELKKMSEKEAKKGLRIDFKKIR